MFGLSYALHVYKCMHLCRYDICFLFYVCESMQLVGMLTYVQPLA